MINWQDPEDETVAKLFIYWEEVRGVNLVDKNYLKYEEELDKYLGSLELAIL